MTINQKFVKTVYPNSVHTKENASYSDRYGRHMFHRIYSEPVGIEGCRLIGYGYSEDDAWELAYTRINEDMLEMFEQ